MDPPAAGRRTLRPMYEVRAPGGGRVVEVLVDEGTMVAEDEPLLRLVGDHGSFEVRTDEPGVLRELLVDPGHRVDAGQPVALVDPS